MLAYGTEAAGSSSLTASGGRPSADPKFSRMFAQLDTARALQAQGRFRASQVRIAEILGQVSLIPVDAANGPRLRALEEQALAAMRGNLPYALTMDSDVEASEELDGLALLDSIQTDTVLSASDSLKYLREFQLDSSSHFDLPVEVNGRVLASLALFKDRIPKHFTIWLNRKGRYESMIREKLRAAGLPQDLLHLSMIESGFNPKAYSPAAASGLWQFLAASGKRFGLRVDRYVDERRDPERATDAAIGYLSFLYNRFGDWNLAMAGYNCGEGCIDRQIKRSGQEKPSYWDLPLPAETRDYVPRIYAATILSRNPAAHGLTVHPWAPVPYDTFTVEGGIQLTKVAEALHCTTDTLVTLNPALVRKMTPPRKEAYVLKLPVGTREAFSLLYPGLEKSFSAPEPTRWVHRLRKGETLASVAARYGVSASEIRSWNRLGKRKLRPGKTLVIYGDPTDSRIAPEETSTSSRRRSRAGSDDEPEQTVTASHRVRSGETLGSIAARYRVSVASLRSQNGLRSDRLRPGQKLRISRSTGRSEDSDSGSRRDRNGKEKAGKESSSKDKARSGKRERESSGGGRGYEVRKGDSIYSIARKHGVSVNAILKANGMKTPRIKPGQTLRIPQGD